ncbi:SpoIIE family protein phosphatase [Micromonospora gifhornensis]|uniref:Cyclic diguanylate phosphodiesterase n=1 Tax=Micromonospora gifhornensis TaxID=84594 RepID=A0ABQ4IK60_9ACTN|nr:MULTISPECIES: GAF domain-containing SpoIIE family protein phosphatase [Micromonospora]PMR59692.1 diguanylate phosphodiesterase [Verrucosispora sp. ts21]GIJ18078.1 cyclic diguanylate phosphodiesterase [Micromonospora gifhornensis]
MAEGELMTNEERLRRFEAITDRALSGLNIVDLFDELLDRVRDLLKVDTATILLLDGHSGELVATAAKGLEEEVRRGFRIRVGEGFAGRVAATTAPVMIYDVTPNDVVNPILLDAGVRALLGVPMLANGSLVGVLHVGSLTLRRFGPEDVQLLQLVADRASSAGQVRAQILDRQAALALQRSLLPSRLPDISGLDLAARYVPGHDLGIGGDWYDVFNLPSGWLGAVIGDVSGHGLPSAVVMGRIRSALRAYALDRDDPAEVLTALDRKIHHFEAGTLTTALYALIAPDRATVHLSCAGHLRPLLAVPGEPTRLVDVVVDRPFGVGTPPAGRHTTVVDLPPGATLVFYTDGLVERRGELIDTGIARLADAIESGPAEALCDHIMAAAVDEPPTDDVALLAIRRPD